MEKQIAIEMENFKTGKSKSQPANLKALEIIRKNFAIISITPSLADQSYPFNGAILFGFLSLAAGIYCTSVFIIYEADTFAEYTQSIYMDSLLIFISIALLILMAKVGKLFEVINCCNDIVNTSELQHTIHLFIYLFC